MSKIMLQKQLQNSESLFYFIEKFMTSEQVTTHNNQKVVNSFIPPYPSKAFDRIVKNLKNGAQTPFSAYLAITPECPNDCWHCSSEKRQKSSIDSKYWYSVIDQLNELGVCIIGFTGGEPLVHSELDNLIEYAANLGITTILFTSAATLTEQRVKLLEKHQLWGIAVSLDHYNEEIFDRLRGRKGAFKDTVIGLKWLADSKIYSMTTTLASHDLVANNLDEMKKIYNLAKMLNVHEFRIIEPMPTGNLQNASEKVLLDDDEVQTLKEFHCMMNKQEKMPKVCSFNVMEGKEVFGCCAGIQHMYIEYSGKVCPCDFTPLSFGNITEEPLLDIWQRMVKAMGQPREKCFIRDNQVLIQQYSNFGKVYPIDTENSCRLCSQAKERGLPNYFKMISK
ncbi:radical SAM protein [Lentisphaerota bacterium WC36G]|nr:radical SAM protein [Lentisphaerae bacterium WC36]